MAGGLHPALGQEFASPARERWTGTATSYIARYASVTVPLKRCEITLSIFKQALKRL